MIELPIVDIPTRVVRMGDGSHHVARHAVERHGARVWRGRKTLDRPLRDAKLAHDVKNFVDVILLRRSRREGLADVAPIIALLFGAIEIDEGIGRAFPPLLRFLDRARKDRSDVALIARRENDRLAFGCVLETFRGRVGEIVDPDLRRLRALHLRVLHREADIKRVGLREVDGYAGAAPNLEGAGA